CSRLPAPSRFARSAQTREPILRSAVSHQTRRSANRRGNVHMVSPLRFSRRSLIKGIALAPLATPAIVWRARAADPILIGVPGTMTGQFAKRGPRMQNGVVIAMTTANHEVVTKRRPIAMRAASPLLKAPTVAGNPLFNFNPPDHVVPIIGLHFPIG